MSTLRGWATLGVGLSLLLLPSGGAAAALAEPPPPPPVPSYATVAGHVTTMARDFQAAAVFPFWSGTLGPGHARLFYVAVANFELDARVDGLNSLDAETFDHYDRAGYLRDAALTRLQPQQDRQLPDRLVFLLAFDAHGRFRGVSYTFPNGEACTLCKDRCALSFVKISDGRLKGDVLLAAKDLRYDLDVDVPMPPVEWGKPLPKEGGQPGRVFLAFHEAMKSKNLQALVPLLDTGLRARWDRHAAEGHLLGPGGSFEALRETMHKTLLTVTITGGYVRDDRAVVLFRGRSSTGSLQGEALLRLEGGDWKIHDEWVESPRRSSGGRPAGVGSPYR